MRITEISLDVGPNPVGEGGLLILITLDGKGLPITPWQRIEHLEPGTIYPLWQGVEDAKEATIGIGYSNKEAPGKKIIFKVTSDFWYEEAFYSWDAPPTSGVDVTDYYAVDIGKLASEKQGFKGAKAVGITAMSALGVIVLIKKK